MLPVSLTRTVIRSLDWLASRVGYIDPRPTHQRMGTRGEEAAYFHLRKLGYIVVARNYRSPRCRGEIDLIGWDADVLCFIEVKTRSSRDVKTAAAAVGAKCAAPLGAHDNVIKLISQAYGQALGQLETLDGS